VNHAAAHLARTGLFFSHPACLGHDPSVYSPGHPDTPRRLIVLEAALAERDWLGWRQLPAPALAPERLELVHDGAHVSRIRELCAGGGGAIDPDTFVVEASFAAALHAAGGACEMARALIAGEADVGFCAVRPAGHHAEAERSMGFCLFNNVALAAASAIAERGAERVLIIDWDVHAGNGTAEIFRHRPDVLLACIHEQDLYPGSGPLQDAGSGEGEGYTINLPVPARSGEPLWSALLREIVIPAGRAFDPDLVLVSCGFDAHAADPLANCLLQTSSFAHIAALVQDAARDLGAPLGLVLEGGYDSAVLAECVCAVLPALAASAGAPVAGAAGGEPPRAAPRSGAPAGARSAGSEGGLQRSDEEVLRRARAQVGRYWPL